MGAVYPEDWTKKVAFMREHSVTSATWSPDGQHLTSAEAAAAPVTSRPDEDDNKRSLTPEQQERARRDEVRRVALGASGGPKPAVAR